jgi:hypothetical protein
MHPFLDSATHRGESGSMGVQCWLRKAFHYIWDRLSQYSDISNQWIFLTTIRSVRNVLDAGANGARGTDQPFRGNFVEHCLDYLRRKCRSTVRQENDRRAATFNLEETS